MSHVAKVDVAIFSIKALKAACKRLGLEFREGQTTYQWYGKFVGEYNEADGIPKEDYGKCLHAIGLPGNGPKGETYEVGIIKNPNGPGYKLVWDSFCGGMGLADATGKNCEILKRTYAACAAKEAAQKQGFSVTEHQNKDGSIRLTCTK